MGDPLAGFVQRGAIAHIALDDLGAQRLQLLHLGRVGCAPDQSPDCSSFGAKDPADLASHHACRACHKNR